MHRPQRRTGQAAREHRQAKLTGAVVEAVTIWHYPAGYGAGPVASGAEFGFEEAAEKILIEALAGVSGLEPKRATVAGQERRRSTAVFLLGF